MSSRESICFYFPYEEDSGVPVLFARMANEIATKYPERKVYFIDYNNGAIFRNTLKLNNIIFIPFEDDVEVTLPQNTILVMQSFVPYHWPKELKPWPDTKLFFWNLHPKNFIPSLLPITFLRDFTYNNFFVYKTLRLFFPQTIGKLQQFVYLAQARNAICFMDETNYESTKKYLFLKDFNKAYLPVPVSAYNGSKLRKAKNDGGYNYCWIGRICDFKAYILVYTANKMAKIASQKKLRINYFIIGDGPFMDYVKSAIDENEFFKVQYLGVLPHAEIDDFLLEKVDVLTAMGTSALEGAKLQIPTILLDFSYEKINGDYVFRMLYNTKNYDLGHAIGKTDLTIGNDSLERIILSIDQNYEQEADKTYQYYLNNHTAEAVVQKFIHLVDNSSLSFGQISSKLLAKPNILKYYYKLTS